MTQDQINSMAKRVDGMSLQPLNARRKQLLQQNASRVRDDELLYWLRQGDVNMSQLNLNPQKKAIIDEYLQKWPNPAEEEDWSIASGLAGNILADGKVPTKDELIGLRGILNGYYDKWLTVPCASEHVAQAGVYLKQIHTKIEVIQEDEWKELDKHDSQALAKYEKDFPGAHGNEIAKYKKEIADWTKAKKGNTVKAIADYITQNSNSHFISDAKEALLSLFKLNLDADELLYCIKAGILNDEEIVNGGLLGEDDLKFIKKPIPELANVNHAITGSKLQCSDGATDVFFFGVPATGKSSILMGLTCAGSSSKTPYIDIDSAQEGSKSYYLALKNYCEAGVVFPGTPGNFVITFQAVVHGGDGNKELTHKVNLVEMAGEDFLNKIALSEQNEISFDSMGTGAADLLGNNHYKALFIIIDPTVDSIGSTKQTDIVKCLVDLFERNLDVMKKVKSIHFIITKSDTLQSTNAVGGYENVLKNYKPSVKKLNELAQKKGLSINKTTNGWPVCYLFSLGKFIGSGRFIYDPAASYRLCAAIGNATVPAREGGWFRKFLDFLN